VTNPFYGGPHTITHMMIVLAQEGLFFGGSGRTEKPVGRQVIAGTGTDGMVSYDDVSSPRDFVGR
jgi:hypothetical protein